MRAADAESLLIPALKKRHYANSTSPAEEEESARLDLSVRNCEWKSAVQILGRGRKQSTQAADWERASQKRTSFPDAQVFGPNHNQTNS